MGSRTDLSAADRKILWSAARGLCSFTQCNQPLVEEQTSETTREPFRTVVGEEAHIYSASPKGPRYDPRYPVGKLETHENRILLCPKHHLLIDANGGEGYSADTLLQMKRRHERRGVVTEALRAYVADQRAVDNHIRFSQANLDGPSVDSMFVDVPFACRTSSAAAELLGQISRDHPSNITPEPGFVLTGAAQALLHPGWSGNAVIVGGPGQGKSTLLQFVCQFHRSRYLEQGGYSGAAQDIKPLTDTIRIPIRLDLRDYHLWASGSPDDGKRNKGGSGGLRSLEQYIVHHIQTRSGGHAFSLGDLAELVRDEPVLLALDGLDEVAQLPARKRVADEIVATMNRLGSSKSADEVMSNLVVLVTTRPGNLDSRLVDPRYVPQFHLQKLSGPLRYQYLNQWLAVAGLRADQAEKLRAKFLRHEELTHLSDLAAYPMQLAILLHLLHKKGLFPEQRTRLYASYLEAFLDREESEEKDPLLTEDREVIIAIHSFLGWYMHKEAEKGVTARQIPKAQMLDLLRDRLKGQKHGLQFAEQLFASMDARVLCLVERQTGFFEFEVQSLQEYFAANHVFEHTAAGSDQNSRSACLRAMVARPYWMNVARFFVGKLNTMEVLGIVSTLRDLKAKSPIGVHQQLRMAAVRFLDDRCYLGQSDDAIEQVVDFVLEGPGLALAEDGFLDETALPLTFSDGAGRDQAVDWLQTAIETQGADEPGMALAASMLIRHQTDHEALGRWWWGRFEPSTRWLRMAADLGVLNRRGRASSTSLGEAVRGAGTESEWISRLLAQGGYSGADDQVLRVAFEEINGGAVEVLPASATPLGDLVNAARLMQGQHADKRVARSGGLKASRWAAAISAASGWRMHYEGVDSSDWGRWLVATFRVWGDGWVLRQAAAATPKSVDPDHVAALVASQDTLSKEVANEVNRRATRSTGEWWVENKATSDLDRRWWTYTLLTVARPDVILAMAATVNEYVDSMSTKDFGTTEAAVRRFRGTQLWQPLDLHDALRLNQSKLSDKVLWLARGLASDRSVDQIDRRLSSSVPALLAAGAEPQRAVFALASSNKKATGLNSLRGLRRRLRSVDILDELRIASLSDREARVVLESPHEWPRGAVARALAKAAQDLPTSETIAYIAERDHWFEEPRRS